jgi:hypothetical protein
MIFCPSITANPNSKAVKNQELKKEIDALRQDIIVLQQMLENKR